MLSDNERTAKLRSFKGLILDADGVLFDGRESRGVLPGGEVVIIKSRHFHDAQALSLLRALGLRVVFATGEDEPLGSIITKINALPSVKAGEWAPVDCFAGELNSGGKVHSLELWLQKYNLSWSECAYIGDDRSDLEAIMKAGLKIVPADAMRVIKDIADIVLTKSGGAGAIREFAEMVLDARGIDEKVLPAA